MLMHQISLIIIPVYLHIIQGILTAMKVTITKNVVCKFMKQKNESDKNKNVVCKFMKQKTMFRRRLN